MFETIIFNFISNGKGKNGSMCDLKISKHVQDCKSERIKLSSWKHNVTDCIYLSLFSKNY